MPQQATYKDRYVCFVDILGFSDAIRNPTHPIFNRSPAYFLEALTQMRSTMERKDLLLTGAEVSQFSDNVAISCPVSPENLHMIIYKTMTLQQFLLRGGLLSRGAITRGPLYHKDGVIFGEALVEAAELEKRDAKMPRVILSQKICADVDMDMSPHTIGRDPDFSYVEYVENLGGVNNENEYHLLKEIIEAGLNRANAHDKCKYKWVAQKYNWL